MRKLGVLVLMVGLTACTPAPLACTDIGSPSGLGVTVTREAAAGLTALTLRVCQGSRCTDHRVTLMPGADPHDEGCTGTDPDSSCSATLVPNGTLSGFLDLPDLAAGPLTVAGTIVRGRATHQLTAVSPEATTTYPNGPQCGAGGNQAQITLEPDGLH